MKNGNAESKRFRVLINFLAPFIGLILVIAIFSLIPQVQERFLRLGNFASVATQSVIVALGALGMTFVIISGGIDLSVASNIALSSCVVAYVINAGLSPWLGLILGVLTGGAIGLLNGALITSLRVVPFIITLGMMGIARGVAKWMAGNQKIDAPITWVNDLMARSPRASLAAPGARSLADDPPGCGRSHRPPLHRLRPPRLRPRLERGDGPALRRPDEPQQDHHLCPGRHVLRPQRRHGVLPPDRRRSHGGRRTGARYHRRGRDRRRQPERRTRGASWDR